MIIRIVWLMAILLYVIQLRAQFAVTGADTPAFGPQELIEEVCLGEGIQVLDIQYSGVPAAVGRFSGGDNIIGLEEGFLMTTGFAATASGGAGSDLPSWWEANIPNGSMASHPDLSGLANDEIFDVAVYTIRFIPTGDSIMFRYVFASDEYPTFVCSKFNDVFGFFLTGPDQDGNTTTINIAKVPGTDLPVSINSVNNGNPGEHPLSNLSFCDGENGSLDNAALFNATHPNSAPVYNGYTDVFVARAAVTPCQEYTMALVLADIGDALWDSGLFFEAKSFCSFAGGGHASEEVTIVESCSPGLLEVALDNFPDDDFPLTYTITGTAEAGVDYVFPGLSDGGQVEGPAGSWLLELQAEDDGLAEGIETIEIRLQGATCSEKTVTIRLVDPLRIEGPPSALCTSGPVTLTVVGDSAALADYPLIWNTGQEGASIQVVPQETTEYVLDYGGYSYSCRVPFTVEVANPEVELNLELCSNDEGVLVNGTRYDFFNPAGVEVLEGGSAFGCDSTVYINITPKASSYLQSGICAGQGMTVNGTLYDAGNPSGMEVIVGGAQDGCDSVVYINLSVYPQQSSSLEATVNEGESYVLGGQSFTANGSYELVFSDQNGCDSLVFLQLNIKTQTTILTDSIAVGQVESLCLDTSIFQSIGSFSNACPQPDAGTEWILQDNVACLEYAGLAPGVDTACIAVCDGAAFCDTTILIVSVFDNLLAALDDYDTTLYNAAASIDVLANDWISATVVDTQYIVTAPVNGIASVNPDGSIAYTPQLSDCLEEDAFTYAICNSVGCDTATVYLYLNGVAGACDAVWPGDVNNDGKVNQVDHWAIGLGYGLTGPVRPNASNAWQAQPMIDWNGSLYFIYTFNRKFADSNGDGEINSGDTYAIYSNWGLSHPLRPEGFDYPDRPISVLLEQEIQASEYTEISLHLGESTWPLPDAYGLAFEAYFDPSRVADVQFSTTGSWLGTAGEDMMELTKVFPSIGKVQVSLVRTDHLPQPGSGRVGTLRLLCPGGDCGECTVRNIQFLQSDGHAFDVEGEFTWQAESLSSVNSRLERQVQLFPNPVREILQVGLPGAGSASLVGVNGQQAWEGALKQGWNEVFVKDLRPGVYILRIQLQKGTVAKKVIVLSDKN